MTIAAIGFDFDHTLGIDNKLERVAFLHVLDEACRHGARWPSTLAHEIETIDALLAAQRAGECTIEHAVEGFLRDRGARDAEHYVQRYKDRCLEMVDDFIIPQPRAREVLARLRERNVPLAILSNGWSPLQERKAERVGFDGPVLVSASLGVQKPDRRAFDALASELGRAPSEIAYVGDSPQSDVAGALAAGMRGIWLDAEGTAYPKDLPPPSAVIHSLEELLSLM